MVLLYIRFRSIKVRIVIVFREKVQDAVQVMRD